MKEITAEVLSIGDELLIGQTMNTNAGWMGAELGLIGIRPLRTRVIGDDKGEILEALRSCVADVVLITGGLGPTKDDITKHTLCEFFNTRLVRHPEIEEHIVSMFVRMGRDPKDVLEVNRAQADLPEACTVVFNARGTASGMWFDRDGRVFVSMPGVPYEMKGIMSEHVLPMLQERFNPPVIVHRTILTAGLGESHLAQRIEGWEDGLAPSGIKLAYLPSPGMVKLRLSGLCQQGRCGIPRARGWPGRGALQAHSGADLRGG
jgi:nicotinamide-nucleotide amidase